jgi:hypothetical protein
LPADACSALRFIDNGRDWLSASSFGARLATRFEQLTGVRVGS